MWCDNFWTFLRHFSRKRSHHIRDRLGILTTCYRTEEAQVPKSAGDRVLGRVLGRVPGKKVSKIFVRNSGAGNGCANLMGAWKNAFFLEATAIWNRQRFAICDLEHLVMDWPIHSCQEIARAKYLSSQALSFPSLYAPSRLSLVAHSTAICDSIAAIPPL